VYLPLDRSAGTALLPGSTTDVEREPQPAAANGRAAVSNGSADHHVQLATGPASRPDTDPTRPRDHASNGAVPTRDDVSLSDTTVLVVDDDFRNIFALTALLENIDATVISAESGPDAISALQRSDTIDIVLMDIMMPGMDGYTAIRGIRALEPFKSIPIIAVTGKVVSGERQRCLDAGANDYVPKPVNNADLLAAIVPWLSGVARPQA
jgi:CheY-like chemotaxis protein